MESLRWVLLLAGLVLIGGIFCYSRGWYPRLSNFRRKPKVPAAEPNGEAESASAKPAPEKRKAPKPSISEDSKVVAVRIMPQHGSAFPAEDLVLAMRNAGLRHGQFGIFHALSDDGSERIRFSVASLVEPGSFDLSNLKESEYRGVSMFAIFPAQEDGVQLFDDMVKKARELARAMGGMLTDEQGGAFSLQRERYMREELVEYLRRQDFVGEINEQNEFR